MVGHTHIYILQVAGPRGGPIRKPSQTEVLFTRWGKELLQSRRREIRRLHNDLRMMRNVHGHNVDGKQERSRVLRCLRVDAQNLC